MRTTTWLTAATGSAGLAYAAYVATAWARYGRVAPARGDAGDALADRFMPEYEVCERHEIHVDAPAEVTFATAKEVELESSRFVRAIFRAREILLRSAPDMGTRPKGLVEAMRSIGWGVLAETPGREIVMGGATKPWEANPVFRALPPDEFAAYREPDHVKILWTLRADPTADGSSIFRTETRAIATDPGARRKFRRYWALLSPGIILIRYAMLPAVKAAAEGRRAGIRRVHTIYA